MPKVFTIGSMPSSAEHVVNRRVGANVRKVIDMRVHNAAQLAGFAKSDGFVSARTDHKHAPARADRSTIGA
jgi:hypothetical protein